MKVLSLTLIAALAAVGSAQAQAPGAPPAPPAPGAQGAAFFQPKMTGTELGAYYFAQTGKRVIVDPEAAIVQVNITILQEANNDKAAQIAAVEKAAALNNLVFIPSGPNEVKLMVVSAGDKGSAIPLVVNADDLPDGDNLVSYVMKLSYIRPEEAQRMFSQMTVLHPYGKITVVENASALVIKETSSLIKMFIELKTQIDVPSSTLDRKWFDLVNADAELVAEKLTAITQAQREDQSPARSARAGTPQTNNNSGNNRPPGLPPVNGAANTSGAASGGGGTAAPTIITTDARQNSILLIGPPSELIFLGELIGRFDAPTSRDGFFSRKLRFLTVVDFLDVAENALSRVEVSSNSQAGGAGNRTNNRNNNTRNTNNRGGNTNGADGGGGNQLSDPGQTGAPESLLVGKTFLVADTITNSIVVQGPPQSVKIINDLLDEIDKAGPQVVISTVFGQYTRNDSNELGLDWIRTLSEGGSIAGSIRNPPSDVRPINDANLGQGAIGTEGGPFGLAGLSLYGQIGNYLNVYLRAAAVRGDFTVLSRPTIYTKNNTRAVISSGTRIAVPTSTINQAVGGTGGLAQNTNIEYRDVELRLEVVPLVNSDNEVTMEISQLNDQIIDDGQQVDGLSVPTIAKQELLTTVTVKNRQTIVLGGLITREMTDNKSGVPFLSDIPGLGSLFSTTRKAEITRELLIFIQPEIINSDEDLDQSQREIDALYEVDERIMDFNQPYAPSATPVEINDGKGGDPVVKQQQIGRHSPDWARRVIRHR